MERAPLRGAMGPRPHGRSHPTHLHLVRLRSKEVRIIRQTYEIVTSAYLAL